MTHEDANDEEVEVSDAVEPGNIIEVEVTNIADFGVFVRCGNGEEGLIHISEVANEFVTNINKYVKLAKKLKLKYWDEIKKVNLSFQLRKWSKISLRKLYLFDQVLKTKSLKMFLQILKKSDEKQVDIRRNLKRSKELQRKTLKINNSLLVFLFLFFYPLTQFHRLSSKGIKTLFIK